jgi:ADP-heptose:LPS heptosyltransferase
LASFAELSDMLVRRFDATVLITGGASECELFRSFEALAKEPVHSLIGELTLKELAALLKRADLMAANSTGPLHIGAAVGTSVIGFYPPLRAANVQRWGPWGQLNSTFTPPKEECLKCTGQSCPAWNCMRLITVEEVMRFAGEILKRKGFHETV